MRSLRVGWHHPWIRHLRLGFNVLLAPIFLWGVLLAGGSIADPRVWIGFLALHVFLYGGANAFNSYYDRDEGPIGGMLEPPPVDEGLLPFSVAVQAIGLPLAAWVGLPFLVAWLALAAVFTAYSHPAVRWKARPAAALAAIALGQGGVGFLAGWWSTGAAWGSVLRPEAWWGAAITCLLLTGLYVVTQSYQVQEDRSRGDRTLPVLLGAPRALGLAAGLLAIGGLAIAMYAGGRFGAAWGVVLMVGALLGAASLVGFAREFDESEVAANFRWVMRFAFASSGALTVFLLWHLAA